MTPHRNADLKREIDSLSNEPLAIGCGSCWTEGRAHEWMDERVPLS
jgi:hypothetical protein